MKKNGSQSCVFVEECQHRVLKKKPAKRGLKPKQISPTGYCRICGSPLDYLKLFWMIILPLPNSFFVQRFTVKPCQLFILVMKVQIDYF